MISTHEVSAGLPPGLWLPTSDESTDQYRVENFNKPDHPYEDIVDYGSFLVALAYFDNNRADGSLMPLREDISDMYVQGYGLSPNGYLRTRYGGVKRLQRSLGFFPKGYWPSQDELTERLTWIKEYAYPLEERDSDLDNLQLHQLILWGSLRRLSPDPEIAYGVYGSDTTMIRRQLGLERRNTRIRDFPSHLYSFGARVITENDGPLQSDELNEKYSSEFTSSPYEAIRTTFGSLAKFWSEFGYKTKAEKLDKDELVSLGVRWSLAHGGIIMDTGHITNLSKQNRFTSKTPVQQRFGRVTVFREEVQRAYDRFMIFSKELDSSGVVNEVIDLVGRFYEVGDVFEQHVTQHVDTLVKLSQDSKEAKYVRSLMDRGLDLLDRTTFEMQREDLLKILTKLGISSESEVRFVLDFVPRLDVEETITSG
jgi:hypothetical protein